MLEWGVYQEREIVKYEWLFNIAVIHAKAGIPRVYSGDPRFHGDDSALFC